MKDTLPAFPHMFAPGRVGRLTLPNRLMMAPMESNLAAENGEASARQIQYYRDRAAGGVGMVIVEYTCISAPGGIGGVPALWLDDDRLIASHTQLASAIRAEGARACVQLFHAGRQTHPKFTGGDQPVAASAIPCPMYRKMPRALEPEEIRRLARQYGAAARRAVAAGYDAVEVHGAHGYLPGNFLSGKSNIRTDEFGGSLANRQRFPLLIVEEIRALAGDVPLLFRLSADEFVEGGTTIDEATDTARALERAGVDAIHVSTGCHERVDRNVDPVWMPQGWRLPLARAVRKAVDIPVIGVGVIRQPEVAEAALARGDADFIALGRALLADPEWPRKARDGRVSKIRPCTSCNWCVAQIGTGHTPVGCAENPIAGREDAPRPVASGTGEQVVVVGAGPGGIAAALTLEQCGYSVTLFEKAHEIARGLVASAAAPGKDKFLWYRDYLRARVDTSSVKLRLGQTADAAAIAALNPVLTVIATGGTNRQLADVTGLDQPFVSWAYDILSGAAPLADGRIVVYGAGEIGCEAAKYAADMGRDVILATRSSDDNALSRSNWLRIYREQFVQMLVSNPRIRIELGARLTGAEPGRFHFLREGNALSFDADALLIAAGRLPESGLADALAARGLPTLTIGDARDVRRIGDAVHDAYWALADFTRARGPEATELTSLAF